MIFILVITAIIIICVYYKYVKIRKIPKGLIELPTEKGLPLIGVLHQVKSPFNSYLRKLTESHGPLFNIRFGMRDILVLNNFTLIKKALKENGDTFSGRWNSVLFKDMIYDSGIIFKDGEVWATQRSFVLKVLRDFGLGKSRSVEIIQDECLSLLTDLELSEGKSIKFSKLIAYYTANIISKFIMNKRFTKKDHNLVLIDNLATKRLKQSNLIDNIYLMFPILNNFERISKIINSIRYQTKLMKDVYEMFHQEIEEHTKALNDNTEGQDLIDMFLIKQNLMKQTNGQVESFTNKQLIRTCFELFAAGYETTSTTLVWSVMFLARFPDVQKQVYEEIIDQIGNERLPTMNDKKSLQYTQAVMDEILRLSTVAPLALMHRVMKDTSLDGYFVPKDIFMFPNLLACHTDPQIWEKPNEFYPEHFLSKDSNGIVKYTPREQLITFSMGPRQCLGESLARMEYFIFLTALLQKFQVSFAESISDEKYQEILRGYDGVIRACSVGNFLFKKRFKE